MLGASDGSLLASKLLVAGHDVTLVCLSAEADLVNRDGTRVRMPVRGRSELVVLDSRVARGRLSADVPDAVDPDGYDLVGLAIRSRSTATTTSAACSGGSQQRTAAVSTARGRPGGRSTV